VLPDPRSNPTAETLAIQAAFLDTVQTRVDDIHRAVRRMRSVREQVQALLGRTKALPAADTIAAAGKLLVAQIDSLEGKLVNVKNKTFQDVVNFAPGLNAQFLALAGAADYSDAGITGGMRARLADLDRVWAGLGAESEAMLGGRLAAFNALVRSREVPAVVLPSP
jgi:hypothetical protein